MFLYKTCISILLLTITCLFKVECCDSQGTWTYSATPSLRNSAGLPTIDLRDPKASTKLASTLQEWGFTYITGHDVPDDVIRRADDESRAFFDLPIQVKRSLAVDRRMFTKTARGYTGVKLEQLDAKGKPDIKEVLDVGHVSIRQKHTHAQKAKVKHYLGDNLWPKTHKGKSTIGLKQAIEIYSEYASDVAQKVLRLTAEGLGCANVFEPIFGPDALQIQRLTRYPGMQEMGEREPGEIGAGVHTDYGGITVLHANGPGLYVLKPNRTSNNVDTGTFSPELQVPNTGEWLNLASTPGTFIVMAGEALQRLSNGLIYAVKHKVDYRGNETRNSLTFFYDPRPSAVLEPLGCLKKKNKALYKSKMAGHKGIVRM